MKQHVILEAPLVVKFLPTLRADEGLFFFGLVDDLDLTSCFCYDTQPGLREECGSGEVNWVTLTWTFWFLLTEIRNDNCLVFLPLQIYSAKHRNKIKIVVLYLHSETTTLRILGTEMFL